MDARGNDRRRLLWRAAAAILVALLLGGLLAWLPRDDSSLEVAARGAGGAEGTTTTTTTDPPSTTTTSRPRSPGGGAVQPPTGTAPTGPSGTTTTAPSSPTTTTTTTAPDTTPPAIGTITASPSSIYESGACSPETSQVSVPVSDPGSGVASVTIKIQVNAYSNTGAATLSGGSYRRTVGPIPYGTTGGSTVDATLTVIARDGAGNARTQVSTSALEVLYCLP